MLLPAGTFLLLVSKLIFYLSMLVADISHTAVKAHSTHARHACGELGERLRQLYLQKAANEVPKGHLLQAKRPSFGS